MRRRCLPVVGTPGWCCFTYAFDDNNVDVDYGAAADDPGALPGSEDRVSWLGEGWL